MAESCNLTTGELCKLLEDYHPRLVAYAKYFTGDTSAAEDVIQDTFYNFFRKYKTCTESEFRMLIFKIARNCCLDWIKHQKVVKGLIVEQKPKGEMLYNFDFISQDTDGGYLYDELLKQVNSILDNLPERCREVFEMSRFKNMGNKEIAEVLNISVKTVKNHMTRALTEFRKDLGETAFVLFIILFL